MFYFCLVYDVSLDLLDMHGILSYNGPRRNCLEPKGAIGFYTANPIDFYQTTLKNTAKVFCCKKSLSKVLELNF